jgi:conjugative transfer signal peptidase TraF
MDTYLARHAAFAIRFLNSRPLSLLIGGCAALSLAFLPQCHFTPRIIYNPSASAPRGWYLLLPAERLKVDDYVLVGLPASAKRLAAERGYLPATVPLLKRIGALSDQFVCVRGRSLWIDGQLAATALTHDRAGRELVGWHDCRVLAPDEILLVSRDNSASFDSRYFGPIRMINVIGRASPLWVWR